MRRALTLALVLLAAGCLEGGGDDGPGTEATAVVWRDLAHDRDSGITQPQRAVLSDPATWDATWALHASGANPKGAAPSVDFATERVVVVALGEKGSGCHDVRVENVTRQGDRVVVAYARFDGETQACAAVMTQPVHFVAIRDRDGDVTFEERLVRPPEPWPHAGDAAPGGDVEPLSVRDLARGSFSPIGEDLRRIVRDPGAWQDLWARHAEDEPAPDVSFPNESVVAVVERGPTGCFGIHVGEVTYDSGARVLTVEVVHEVTPEGYACIQAISHAYHFVAIPDRPGEVRFVDVEGAPKSSGAPGGPEPEPEPEPDAPQAGTFRTLDRGSSSGIRETRRSVISTGDAWAAFWDEHTANRIPRPMAPEVHFDRERVFAALGGDRPSTCWSVVVERVEEGPDNVTVEVVTYSPSPGAMCGFAVTQPYHVVALPASSKPVIVVETARQGPS